MMRVRAEKGIKGFQPGEKVHKKKIPGKKINFFFPPGKKVPGKKSTLGLRRVSRVRAEKGLNGIVLTP